MLKRRTSWMLVSIRAEEGPRLWIPLPIWFVCEVLRGLWILAWCFPRLARLPHRMAAQCSIPVPNDLSAGELLGQVLQMLEAVRRAGPFTLVQVRDGHNTVSVRLV